MVKIMGTDKRVQIMGTEKRVMANIATQRSIKHCRLDKNLNLT